MSETATNRSTTKYQEVRRENLNWTDLYISGEHGMKFVRLPKSGLMENRLVQEMVRSVTQGYKDRITIKGVGYRAQKEGDKISISLGYKKPIEMPIPKNVKIQVKGAGTIIEGWSTSKRDLRQYLGTIVEIRVAAKDKYTKKGVEKWTE